MFARRPPLRVEQPGTRNRDPGLLCRGREDLEVLAAERVFLRAFHHQDADHLPGDPDRDVYLRTSRRSVAHVPGFGRYDRGVVQSAIEQWPLAQTSTRRDSIVLVGARPPDAGAHQALSGGGIEQEHPDEVVPERIVVQSVHHAGTDRVLVVRRGDPRRQTE